MSGYSKIYCIGGEGGFLGSDGMNPIDFQILVGDGNRQRCKMLSWTERTFGTVA